MSWEMGREVERQRESGKREGEGKTGEGERDAGRE